MIIQAAERSGLPVSKSLIAACMPSTIGEIVNQEDFKAYLQELVSKLPTVNYIERRFALAKDDGHLSQDFDYFKSSLPRDRQPDLAEVLEQKQLLVLAEPGGGKSIVAKAAVREFTKRTDTLP